MATFKIEKGQTAKAFTQGGGIWNPHTHFTGETTDEAEVAAVQEVVDRHADGIIAYHDYVPWKCTYSLELQFQTEEQAEACCQDYMNLFTVNGRLKKKYRKEK